MGLNGKNTKRIWKKAVLYVVYIVAWILPLLYLNSYLTDEDYFKGLGCYGLGYMFDIPVINIMLAAILSVLLINHGWKDFAAGIKMYLEGTEYEPEIRTGVLRTWKNFYVSIRLGGALAGTMYLMYGFSYLYRFARDITDDVRHYFLVCVYCALLSLLYTMVLHIIFLPIYQQIQKDMHSHGNGE